MRLTCIHGNDAAPGWKPGKTARNFHPAPSHAALHALRLSVALLPRVEARGWSIYARLSRSFFVVRSSGVWRVRGLCACAVAFHSVKHLSKQGAETMSEPTTLEQHREAVADTAHAAYDAACVARDAVADLCNAAYHADACHAAYDAAYNAARDAAVVARVAYHAAAAAAAAIQELKQ